jgi:hypothetical protein
MDSFHQTQPSNQTVQAADEAVQTDQRERWESHIRMEREAHAARAAAITAPARLWLQVDQESPNVDESTWCQDKINDTDVLYVRADLAGVMERNGSGNDSPMSDGPNHVCGEQGFGHSIDDVCPACSAAIGEQA